MTSRPGDDTPIDGEGTIVAIVIVGTIALLLTAGVVDGVVTAFAGPVAGTVAGVGVFPAVSGVLQVMDAGRRWDGVLSLPPAAAIPVTAGPVRTALRITGGAVRLLSPAARARYRDELVDELYDMIEQHASWCQQVACSLRQLTTVPSLRAAARSADHVTQPALGSD